MLIAIVLIPLAGQSNHKPDAIDSTKFADFKGLSVN